MRRVGLLRSSPPRRHPEDANPQDAARIRGCCVPADIDGLEMKRETAARRKCCKIETQLFSAANCSENGGECKPRRAALVNFIIRIIDSLCLLSV